MALSAPRCFAPALFVVARCMGRGVDRGQRRPSAARCASRTRAIRSECGRPSCSVAWTPLPVQTSSSPGVPRSTQHATQTMRQARTTSKLAGCALQRAERNAPQRNAHWRSDGRLSVERAGFRCDTLSLGRAPSSTSPHSSALASIALGAPHRTALSNRLVATMPCGTPYRAVTIAW